MSQVEKNMGEKQAKPKALHKYDKRRISLSLFLAEGVGSVGSVRLPLTPFLVQERMTFLVPGVDSEHGGRGHPRSPSHCLLLILGTLTAWPGATGLIGRFRETHPSRRGDGRELTPRASLKNRESCRDLFTLGL